MNDLERFENLISDFGIGYRKTEEESKILIELKEGAEKVGGYNEFVTYFFFDLDGKFIEVKLYE